MKLNRLNGGIVLYLLPPSTPTPPPPAPFLYVGKSTVESDFHQENKSAVFLWPFFCLRYNDRCAASSLLVPLNVSTWCSTCACTALSTSKYTQLWAGLHDKKRQRGLRHRLGFMDNSCPQAKIDICLNFSSASNLCSLSLVHREKETLGTCHPTHPTQHACLLWCMGGQSETACQRGWQHTWRFAY